MSHALSLILAGTMLAQSEPPQVKIPEPGVPQIMTMEGRYVRAAYNNEAYAILGYRLANGSVGQPWLLLEIGATVRSGVASQTLTRESFSLDARGSTDSTPTVRATRVP